MLRAASLRSRGRSRDLKLPSPRRRGGAVDAPRAVDAPLALPRDAVAATAPAARRRRATHQRRSHIKGLLINCLHHFWPSLLEIPGFLRCFITPIVKATSNSKKGPSKTFFTVSLRRPSTRLARCHAAATPPMRPHESLRIL